jgi:hypothetical protein
VLASWEMTLCAELTEPISIYSFDLPVPSFFSTAQPRSTRPSHRACTYYIQQQPLQSITSNQQTTLDQLLSPRATLRSSAISNASAFFCQPHSLPATIKPQYIFVDYYSRRHSQCLPPASLLAPVLLRTGLSHLFPNESIVLAIAPTAKPCLPRRITHT